MRYAASKLATKSARRPKELDEFEVKDELASFKMYSSGGAGVEGPFKTEANGVACEGGGFRRGRSGARDGDHGVCWRER